MSCIECGGALVQVKSNVWCGVCGAVVSGCGEDHECSKDNENHNDCDDEKD